MSLRLVVVDPISSWLPEEFQSQTENFIVLSQSPPHSCWIFKVNLGQEGLRFFITALERYTNVSPPPSRDLAISTNGSDYMNTIKGYLRLNLHLLANKIHIVHRKFYFALILSWHLIVFKYMQPTQEVKGPIQILFKQ